MTEEKKEVDELEALFKVFDEQHAECQQKITDIEKQLEDFRKEKAAEEEQIKD